MFPSGVLGKNPVIGGLGLAQESIFPKLPLFQQEVEGSLPILHVEDLIPPLNHLLGGYCSLDGG